MPSIAQIQKQLKHFDTVARRAVDTKHPESSLKKAWHTIFSMDMSDASAKSFARYYREMRSKSSRRSMRGGAATSLAPATLDYQMTPGANVQVYGRFPVEVDTDPSSLRNLDVYFQDSLTKGCGMENSGLQVPANMGSNQVGGRRKASRKASRKNRKASRKNRKNSRKSNRKTYRKNRRNHSGGNLMNSLATHPYLSTSPPSLIQGAAVSWAGAPQPVSGSPVVPGWNYHTKGNETLINPGFITRIGDDMTKLASPSPWQTTN